MVADGAGWDGTAVAPGAAGNAVDGWGTKPVAGNSVGAESEGGAVKGAVPSSSVANTGVPPYSTAALRDTTSERWITAQRMGAA